jgi:hypothetical protein
LGWRIDQKKIEAELDKVRKTLNMQSLSNQGLFDPEDASETQLKILEEQMGETERLNVGISDEIKRMELQIKADLSDVCGEYNDEISLLNQVGGMYFQCIPEYHPL